MKLLQKILEDPGSRPFALWQALQPTSDLKRDGDQLRVDIPAGTMLQRRWTRVVPQEQAVEGEDAADSPASAPLALSSTDTSPSATQPLDFQCKRCSNVGPEAAARAFVQGPTPLTVVLCENRLQPSDYATVLTHELVHVYDVTQLRLNLRDCESLAYSEVRAAAQAECVNNPHPEDCWKRTARRATQNLFPYQGASCVHRVWKQAVADARPG